MAWRALLLTVALLCCCTADGVAAIEQPPRPHMVFIVVDDMGYHNIRAPPLHVNSEISSPRLARMAKEGITLSNYYAYRYCGPSRASLLTGRYPGHGISEGMFSSASPRAYNGNLTLLPAKLKAAGYRTHGIGKWYNSPLYSVSASMCSRLIPQTAITHELTIRRRQPAGIWATGSADSCPRPEASRHGWATCVAQRIISTRGPATAATAPGM